MSAKRTRGYTERDDYFPKSVRKEFKIGEYAESNKKATSTKKKVVKKKK